MMKKRLSWPYLIAGVLGLFLLWLLKWAIVVPISDPQPEPAPQVAPAAAAPEKAAAKALDPSLAEARRGFKTAVAVQDAEPEALPEPPAELYIRSDYVSAGMTLAAFVTPDPKDGEKHPAILWLTGGDSNTLGDFWIAGPESNDQSAQAFRQAGVVTMFPTLRGGNTNPGAREFFLGEVEDVLAAAEHLASLPYVDPAQIYLGGHSTGGTLALLVAETSPRFAAVFALGPADDVRAYPENIVPVDWQTLPDREADLRSPRQWLGNLRSPTYVIEGERSPSNHEALKNLCDDAPSPQLHCLSVPAHNHFSIVSATTRLVAARIAVPVPGGFTLHVEDFAP